MTWPSDVYIGTFDAGVQFNVQLNVMRDGSITTYRLPGARWVATVGFEPDVEQLQRPRVEALVASLEGGANSILMPHWGRKIPNGSLRGAPTVNNSVAAGAKQIVLANVNGTLLRGDVFGILGQNLMVTADAAPSGGTMTVNFAPALRVAAGVGAAVTWSQPAINWLPRTSLAGPFPYRQGGIRPGFSIELVEVY